MQRGSKSTTRKERVKKKVEERILEERVRRLEGSVSFLSRITNEQSEIIETILGTLEMMLKFLAEVKKEMEAKKGISYSV